MRENRWTNLQMADSRQQQTGGVERGREAGMPDMRYWGDTGAREELMARGRAAFERIRGELGAQVGVVAIEPESGAYLVGTTLGKVNDVAYERFPDRWLYFVRVDDPSAEIVLPTW